MQKLYAYRNYYRYTFFLLVLSFYLFNLTLIFLVLIAFNAIILFNINFLCFPRENDSSKAFIKENYQSSRGVNQLPRILWYPP